MSPEQQPELSHLFEQVLSQPPERRWAYLAEISSGDDVLRRRLEAMLATEEGSARHVGPPDPDAGAGWFGAEHSSPDAPPSAVPVGKMIGSYRLLGQIGRGGMGEVYLAEDTRLDRRVALKLLPERLTGHPDRVSRFQREARAASALTHPNILTIHDFGEHDGRRFIASEFVEGQTLRELIDSGTATCAQSIEIVEQVAGALAAAHEAGIIHRDIKPENLMLRPDGYVKVLDFGLAKLAEPDASGDEAPGESAPSAFETRAGIVLGTVNYMSPEQARGQKVDSRSDLFSLGVVLYELVTGLRPFAGATPNHVLVAILDHEPPPLAASCPEAPAGLQRIVSRALAKQPEERYRTALELLADLRGMKQELRGGAGDARPRGSGAQAAGIAAPVSRLRRLLDERRGLLLAIAAGVLGLAALATGFAGGWLSWPRLGTTAGVSSRDRMQVERVTSAGEAAPGTISPDGSLVAYMLRGQGGASLWIREVSTGSTRQLLPPGDGAYWSLAISPDNAWVYYAHDERVHPEGGVLYRIPVSGGDPRRILVGAIGLALSPDGRRIAFSGWEGNPKVRTIRIATVDGGDVRPFAVGTRSRDLTGFVWSSDGRAITYVLTDEDADGAYWEVVERPLDGGAERTIVRKHRQQIAGVAWLPDRSGLVMTAEEEASGARQIFFLSYPEGNLSRITNDLIYYGGPVLTADGRTLLTSEFGRPSRIWIAPVGDPGRARPISAGTGSYGDLSWTPDGRLVYVLAENGERNLWLTAPDGGEPRQLTRNLRSNFMPDVAPDGRSLVCVSDRTGVLSLWRMDLDGGHPVQLTDHYAWAPQVSRDGVWVVYQRSIAGKSSVWKVPLAGGTPVQMAEAGASRPALSPDGRLLAYEYLSDAAQPRKRVTLRSLSGGEPPRMLDIHAGYDTLRWTPDGSALAYVYEHDLGSQIVAQPIGGGPQRELATAPYETVFAFALSRDGKRIAYTSGQVTESLVLFRNFH